MYIQKQKPAPIRIFLICIAAVINAINLNSFVHAGSLYPGGFTGVTLLIQEAFRRFSGGALPFAPINIIFNSVPAIISFRYIGKKYTLYSCLMIVATSFMADLIPIIPIVEDVLLSAVFGGIVGAIPTTLCLLAGASAGGTDFISIFISEKYGRDGFTYIFIFNMFILVVAGILFGWEAALYSIIFQFVAKQMLQSLYRRYQKVTLFIITENPEVVYKIIHEGTNHDATRIDAVGCYTNQPKTILYSVISGDEAHKISSEVRRADPKAFINVMRSEQIMGNFYSRPKD